MNNNFLDTNNFKYLINFVFNDIKQKTHYDISNNNKYINIFKKLVQTIHKKNMNKRVSKEYLNNLVIDKCVPFIIKQLEKENTKIQSHEQRDITISNRPMTSKYSKQPNKQNQMNQPNDFSYLTLNNQENVIVDNVAGISSRNGEKIDYSSRLKEFQEDRGYDNGSNMKNPNQLSNVNELIGGNNNNTEDKIDIMKKMQELQNERNYVEQNTNMNNFDSNNNTQNIRNNEQLNQVTNQNVEIDNSFLQQLYANNANNANNTNNANNANNNENDPTNELLLNKLSNNYLEDVDGGDNELVSSYQNLELNIIDKSNNNKLPQYNSNIDNLVEEQDSSKKEENNNELKQQIWQSTNFNYGRKKRILCIDVSNNLETIAKDKPAIDNISGNYWSNFRVNLKEDFIIDKVSDIYLESITINRPAQANNFSNLYYVIDIDEFNIKTNTNNTFMADKFIIPNENTESFGNNKIMKYHKKSNYVAQINPTKLSSLTFSITNENNETVNTSINADSTTTVVAFTPSGNTGTININGYGTNLHKNDAVYNGNNNLVGILTADGTTNAITFGGGTLVDLGASEKLFLSSFKTNVLIKHADGYSIGDTSLTVDTVDATTKFSKNSNVYLGNGNFVGKVTEVSGTFEAEQQDTITIGDGTQIHLSDNDILYNGNPLPTVFSSNSKANRMIMEFVLITK